MQRATREDRAIGGAVDQLQPLALTDQHDLVLAHDVATADHGETDAAVADEGEVPLAVQSGALLMVMPEVGKVREPALLSM